MGAGAKTRSSCLWLTHEDVAAFSAALHAAMPQLHWYCSHVGADRNVAHEYETMAEALNCPLGEQHKFSGQAYTMLPVGASDTLGLLLFNFTSHYPERIEPEKDFGPATDKSVYPKEFLSVRDSGLSIRWNTNDGDIALCDLMSEQVKQVWRVLNSVTKPFKCHELVDGLDRSTARYRIGPHMLDKVKSENWVIQQSLFYVVE